MTNEKSQMDLQYEEYLNRSDRVLAMGGNTYFRIVKKDFLEIGGKPVTMITVPAEIMSDTKCNRYCDENGTYFEAGLPAHFSFRGTTPSWYRETLTLPVHGLDIDRIGMYVRQVPVPAEDNK